MTDPAQSKFGALASVLGKDISQIEDLPNYVAPPAGVYKMLIQACGQKVINEKTVIAVDYVFLECKSLNNAEEDRAELDGMKIAWKKDRMSELFYFNDAEKIENTLSVLKKKFASLGATLGKTNLLEILEGIVGMTIEAQIGRRSDDNDKTRFFPYTRTMVAAA